MELEWLRHSEIQTDTTDDTSLLFVFCSISLNRDKKTEGLHLYPFQSAGGFSDLPAMSRKCDQCGNEMEVISWFSHATMRHKVRHTIASAGDLEIDCYERRRGGGLNNDERARNG